MSALVAINTARKVGLQLELDGDELVLTADGPPPSDIVDLVTQLAVEIAAELDQRLEGGTWRAQDWQVFFDERAAIAEFDQGLSREFAEALAFDCCVSEWLSQNAANARPIWRTGCGVTQQPTDARGASHTIPEDEDQRHHHRPGAGHARQLESATAALSDLGIKKRGNR